MLFKPAGRREKMQKLFVIIMLIFLLVVPSLANAETWSDDFGGNDMNSALWTLYEGSNLEHICLVQEDGRLAWLADGWSTGETADKGYLLKQPFSLDNDFSTKVDFHYSHEGSKSGDNGALEFALFNQGGSTEVPEYIFSLIVGNFYHIEDGTNQNYFEKYMQTPGTGEGTQILDRDIPGGTLYARYIAATDKLEYKVEDTDGAVVDSEAFNNFKATFGINTLNLALFGMSEGADLATGEAYMDNFRATAAPEPLSMSLFLFGAGVIGFRKHRKSVK